MTIYLHFTFILQFYHSCQIPELSIMFQKTCRCWWICLFGTVILEAYSLPISPIKSNGGILCTFQVSLKLHLPHHFSWTLRSQSACHIFACHTTCRLLATNLQLYYIHIHLLLLASHNLKIRIVSNSTLYPWFLLCLVWWFGQNTQYFLNE